MSSLTRWLVFSAVALSLLCSSVSLWTVHSLTSRMQHLVATNMLVVPSGVVPANAGIAPSNDGNELALWLGRMDSNAQTRMSVLKDGEQRLAFYDRQGKLRLVIGLDAAGNGHIRFLDKDGKELPINGVIASPPS